MDQLLLIRHGQTEWNKEGRYTGQSDIPLTELGHQQAQQAAEKLVDLPPDVLYSSDLLRARQTAAPLSEMFSLDVSIDPRLKEINQGQWEGMLFPDIKQKFAKEFAAQRSNPVKVGAPGGETVEQVRTRVFSALEDIITKHADSKSRVVVVSHGFVIALIRLYFSNKPIEHVWDLIPGNVEIITVDKPTAA